MSVVHDRRKAADATRPVVQPPPLPRRRWRGVPPAPSVEIRLTVPTTFRARSRRVFRVSRGWLISAAVHAVVMLLLLCLASDAENGEYGDVLWVTHQHDEEIAEPARVAEFKSPNVPSRAGGSGRFDSLAPTAHDSDRLPDPSVTEIRFHNALSFGGRGSQGAVGEALSLFDGSDRLFAEIGQQSGHAEFFGVRATGTKFVFVVDSSGSMMGKKWTRACRELLQSVEKLGANQRFCVFFFDADVHLMFNQDVSELEMIPATPENLKKLRRWMLSIKFGDATKPFQSVKLAMHMRPDAVFLLSDGEFDDPTATFLRLENRVRDEGGNLQPEVALHTIGFKSRMGQPMLQQLADENRGTYRFVP